MVQSDFRPSDSDVVVDAAEFKEWGPILEVWEGHASDPELRFRGSSGGALSAISLFCLERGGMHGVLQTGQDPLQPLLNRTRLSRSRADLLAAVGSRYSPASVCDGLGLVESAPGPCVVIGKPVEIAAVRNARRLRPAIDKNIGLTLSFFCAESPSTAGTLELLKSQGITPDAVTDLRYRGEGWPGHFAPVLQGASKPAVQIPYRESWSFLQRYRPWSTQMWPDGSGEQADISCGDPWYEEPDGRNPGFSLVVVRTETGRRILEAARNAGYLTLTPADRWKLEKSQKGLLQKKGAVWGRRLAMRMLALPVTEFTGLDLFHSWKKLTIRDKLKSVVGTLRRVLTRGIYRRASLRSRG